MQDNTTRRSPRVNRLFLISYVNREGNDQKTPISVGRTLNVSAHGAGMEIFQEVRPGSLMDMEFDLQDSLLKVQGTVVHVRREEEARYFIGVQFDETQDRLGGLTTG